MKARNGFTLIELTIVLVVLAALTHLAVRELSHIRAAQLHKAADKQLESIRDCVWSVSPDGEMQGFLSDMGRLPRPVSGTNSTGAASGNLSELWNRPASVRAFAPLSSASVTANAESLVVAGWGTSQLAPAAASSTGSKASGTGKLVTSRAVRVIGGTVVS